MNLPIPIFRNDINALGDFKGGVKVARDFARKRPTPVTRVSGRTVFYERSRLNLSLDRDQITLWNLLTL